jgi:hypothetical protein
MRRVAIAGALAGLLPSSARGQEEADSLVFHHAFTTEYSARRILLQKDVVYRANLRGAGRGLRVRGTAPHARNPFVALTSTSGDSESLAVYQVYGADSGEYEVSLAAPGTGPTTIDWYLDRRLTAERQTKATKPRWTFGVEVSAGAHAGYQIGSTYTTDPGPPSERIPTDPDDGGSAVEGCLSIHSGRRFSGCLGIEHQSRPGNDMSVDWYFIEPRFAAVRSLGPHPLEAGVSFRFAQGSQGTDVAVDPSMLAPGLFVAYYLNRRPTGQGLSLRASAYYAWLGNTNTTGDKPTTFRAAAGITWHP